MTIRKRKPKPTRKQLADAIKPILRRIAKRWAE
jgi:hypothetical protein